MVWFARLLIGVAAVCTLLLLPTMSELRPLSGADAMGLIVVMAVMGARWISLGIAWLVAASLERVPWLARRRVGQAAGALVFHAAAGAVSFGSLVLATGPDSAAVRPWAWLFMLVVPAASQVAAWAALSPRWARVPATPAKVVAVIVSAAVLWGGVSLWLTDRARSADAKAQQDAASQERQRVLDARLSALRTDAAEAPLSELLRWLEVPDGDVVDEAVRLVRQRPALNQELAVTLAGPDGVRALRYIHLWMPGAPAELAGPARDATARWAASVGIPETPEPAEPAVLDRESYPPRRESTPVQACESVVAVATVFSKTGVDFSPALRDALRHLDARALPDERASDDPTQPCRDYLRTWLSGRR